ncbi:hypothetical protein BKA81DRAFT_186688 [Phyllosticta paracitricarpa]
MRGKYHCVCLFWFCGGGDDKRQPAPLNMRRVAVGCPPLFIRYRHARRRSVRPAAVSRFATHSRCPLEKIGVVTYMYAPFDTGKNPICPPLSSTASISPSPFFSSPFLSSFFIVDTATAAPGSFAFFLSRAIPTHPLEQKYKSHALFSHRVACTAQSGPSAGRADRLAVLRNTYAWTVRRVCWL